MNNKKSTEKNKMSNSIKSSKLRSLCIAAIFGAIIFVCIAFLPRIPMIRGYVHFGDAFIYLAASILPAQYAIIAAIIGGGLADTVTGYAIWAPATIIIKGLCAASFSSKNFLNINDKNAKILNKRNIVATFLSLIFCAGGYYLYEALIFSNFVSPLTEVPANIFQSIISGIIYFLLSSIIDNNGNIKRIIKSNNSL